jgi:hypothetical protein
VDIRTYRAYAQSTEVEEQSSSRYTLSGVRRFDRSVSASEPLTFTSQLVFTLTLKSKGLLVNR